MNSMKGGWSRIGLLLILLAGMVWSAGLTGPVTAIWASDVKAGCVQEGKGRPVTGDSGTCSRLMPGKDIRGGSGTDTMEELSDSYILVEVAGKADRGILPKALSPRKSLSADQERPDNSSYLKVGWLGAQVRRVKLQTAEATGSSYGILIDAMEAASPARQGGLLKGDILLEINGKSLRSIRSIDTYFHIIGSQKPGSPVQLEVLRQGKRLSITVTSGERLVQNGYLEYRLSKLYQYGDQVAYDPVEANRLLHQAADAGYTRAQFELGFAYANGLLRLKKDGKSAAKYYRLAADQGDSRAQVELAGLYDRGWGVEKDLRTALRYYRLAADQESMRGQYHLGQMYETGRGVVQDKEAAIAWYRKAAAQNYKPAIKDLKRLER